MPHDNYSIIPHINEPRILILESEAGWTLPHHDTDNASDINRAMKMLLGIDTIVLYCAYDRYKDDEREEQHRVYALENHSPLSTLPTNARWISRTELPTLKLAIVDHQRVLEEWFRQAETPVPRDQRVPWAASGWFASATHWLQEQMDTLGFTLAGPIEQVQVSIWSTVLRIPTTTKTLYLKASAPVFAYEPLLTQKLSELVPTYVPPVLVIDHERHWMLMLDAGNPLSQMEDLRTDSTHWEEALRRYAHMQIHLLEQQETLLAVGCPDRRLDLLPTLLEDALSETALLLLDSEQGLSQAEYAQLQACIPELRAMCVELQRHGIPESLHHDDLHGSNILLNEKGILFFDWAECAITHPFCSLVIVERVFRYVLEYSPEVIAHLRDCYLQQWTQFESMEDLQTAYAIAQRLGKLCRALTWRHIVTHLQPSERWEHEGAYPYWLRVFLQNE